MTKVEVQTDLETLLKTQFQDSIMDQIQTFLLVNGEVTKHFKNIKKKEINRINLIHHLDNSVML